MSLGNSLIEQNNGSISGSLPFWRQIRWNLVVSFALLAALPLFLVTAIVLPQRSIQDEAQVKNQLASIAEIKANQIQSWLEQGVRGVNLILADPIHYGSFQTLLSSTADDPTRQGQINLLLSRLVEAHPSYEGFFLYDVTGQVLAASDAVQIGKNVRRQPYFEPSLNTADYIQSPFYEVGSRELALFLTEPILGRDGHVVGAFAASFKLTTMGQIMTESNGGFPNTGETYLVSSQTNYLLTPSRFAGYPLTQAYRSEGINRALAGTNGSDVYAGYRDVQVVGAYRWVPSLQAALVAEVEQSEALEASNRSREANVVVAAVAALIAAGLGFVYASSFARPIMHLTQTAVAITGGDYTQRVQVRSRNEIGQLTNAFNTMTAELQNNITELKHLNEELEERVALRTRDLQIASDRNEQLFKEAERANQVKSMFLANMSHELRTPLNAVINFTKFVARGVMGPVTDRQKETLTTVIDSAKHLLNLINDVLDMSKIESGSLNLFVEANVNLSKIVQSAAETARGLLADRPIELRLEVDDDLPIIMGDRQRIMQILLNMVSNACKFTQEGHVVIRACRQGDEILLAVGDTGPGIEPEDVESVFEPFKQTQTGLRQGSGTGLGMPISKSLAEAHGGQMWLESVPGQGATFNVVIPIKSEVLTPSLA